MADDFLAGASGLTAGIAAGLKEKRQQSMIEAKLTKANAQSSVAAALEMLSYDIPTKQKEQILSQFSKMFKLAYNIDISSFGTTGDLEAVTPIFNKMSTNTDKPEVMAKLANGYNAVVGGSMAGLTPQVDNINDALQEGFSRGGGLIQDTREQPQETAVREPTFRKLPSLKPTKPEKVRSEVRGGFHFTYNLDGSIRTQEPIAGIETSKEKDIRKKTEKKESRLDALIPSSLYDKSYFTNGQKVTASTLREYNKKVQELGEPVKLSSKDDNTFTGMPVFRQQLDKLEGLMTELLPDIAGFGGWERFVEGKKNAWAKLLQTTKRGEAAREAEALIESMTPMWARISGHTGVLTLLDFESAKKSFAKTGGVIESADTQAVSKQLFANMRAVTKGKEDQILSGGKIIKDSNKDSIESQILSTSEAIRKEMLGGK